MRIVKDLERYSRLQKRLSQRITIQPLKEAPQRIGGVDAAYIPDQERMVGVIVVLDYPSLRCVECCWAVEKVPFPYVPGFLSFRELPVLQKALQRLKHEVSLFMVDGQGIWHPRRLGIAAHFGLLVKKPTIGVAKSPLVPPQCSLPDKNRGSVTYDTLGAIVRTRTNVKPVYVSVGNLITLQEAVFWTLQLSRYRLPEPTRQADKQTKVLAKQIRYGTLSPSLL